MTQADAAHDDPAVAVPQVRITRHLAAPRAIVWRAFTDPNALTSWFWPARLAPRVQAETQVGGRYRIASAVARTMASAISGEYLAVVEPDMLVFTWRWEGGDTTSQVTVRLCPADDGTELIVEHDQLADEEDREAQSRSWRDCLDRLPDWLAAATARAST
jgi:uncharacterized protein YndB with AHSA1/START domain